jgi:glucose-1-phosphate thymidylyltransferase
MKALILSGGHGTRMRPLTWSQQKQLIPVANRPVLFYAIDDCVEAGAEEVGVVTGPNADQVRETVRSAQEDGEWPGVTIDFVHQGDPRGIAHAVLVAHEKGFLDRETPFVLYLGDNILSGGVEHLADPFLDRIDERGLDKVGANIMLCPRDDPTEFGVADIADDGSIRQLVEKPSDPPSNLVLIGVYFFGPAVLDAVRAIEPSWRDELEITEAIQWLLDEGYSVRHETVQGWWKDTGGPRDMLGANRLVLDELEPGEPGTPDVDGEVVGRVRIGEGATVDAESTVKGPAIVGADATIEGSYVGPYTSVGPDVALEGAEVEDSILLQGSTIRGVERVRESVLGRGVTIEPGQGRPAGRRFVVGDQSRIEL